MNASWWHHCPAPEEMLWLLHTTASDRLLRLFACACCRQIWPLLPTAGAQRAVEMSERFADGLLPAAALEQARARLRPAASDWLAWRAAAETVGNDPWHAAQWTPAWAAEAEAEATSRSVLHHNGNKGLADQLGSAVWEEARAIQCARLRDIFGNPFERAVVNPSWLLWENGRVQREARAIYNQRCFDDLPRLGRVLEAAGCDDTGILAHCRQPHGHVLGCWVLDLLLEKREMRTGDHDRSAAWLHRQPCPPSRLGRGLNWEPPAASALRRGVA